MPRVPATRRRRFSRTAGGPGGGAFPVVMPGQADHVVERVGVNVHAYAPYTATATRDDMQRLGFRHYRMDRADVNNQAFQGGMIDTLAAAGLSCWWVTDERGLATPAQVRTYVESKAGKIKGVTGPNETNQTFGTNPSGWPLTIAGESPNETGLGMSRTETWRQYRDVAQAIADAIGCDLGTTAPAMRGNPLWLDVLADAQPGDVRIDKITLHQYFGGYDLEADGALVAELDTVARRWPGKRVILDETGLHTHPADTSTHKGTPVEIALTYLARFPVKLAKFPLIERAYLYELYDEPNKQIPDPDAPDPNEGIREGFFGLMSAPGVYKAHGLALKRTLALYDDPGEPHNPQGLPVLILNTPAGLHTDLRQKRDGTWLLALWREMTIYNPATETVVTPGPAVDVTVDFVAPRTVTAHTPATGAVSGPTTAASRTVSLRQDMVVLEIS